VSFRAKKPPTCWRAGIRLSLAALALTVCGSGITAQEIPQPLATRLATVPQREGVGEGRLNVPSLAAPGTGAISTLQGRQPLGVPGQRVVPQQRNSPRRALNGLRLPYLPELPQGLGTPKSDPLTRERYGRFVTEELDPEQTLTLVVNRPKVLRFREAPVRTYIPEAGSEVIALRYVDPASATHVAIEPLQTGSTVLSMWFKDPTAPGGQQYLSWMVNVVEDPEQGRRLEAVYAALEREINQNFPNSVVRLSLVGDKLLVRGQAKDIQDASQILRIVGSNAPGGPEAVPVRNIDLNLVSGLNPNGDNAFDDGEIQSLLLRTAEQDAIEAGSTVINMLRVAGEQQVNLKVIVAEVNRNALRAIGANMSLGPGNSTSFMSAFGTQSVVEGLNSNIVSAEGGTFGINRGDFQLAVNALRGLGYARTLAEPNVVSLNGQPAIFRAGDTFPVPASNVSFGAAAQSVSQQFVGVQIRFLPVITDNDRIRLQLSGTVSTLDNALQANIGGANVPGTNTRNFFTTVELREGQTLALAGLISSASQGNSSRVPLLGDLPGLGRLFNTDDTAAQEQELLILVTPQLVRPLDNAEGLPLPGSDIFEPDDLEFYVNGRIESCRPEDYRSPIRTSWDRIRAGRQAQSRLLIGPSGYSNGLPQPTQAVPATHVFPPTGVVPAQHVAPIRSGRARLGGSR
jgi:pilus assembly protein CpaC